MRRKGFAWIGLLTLAAQPVVLFAQKPDFPVAGSGLYPASFEEDPSLPDHVVYRPQDLAALRGRKLPVYVWGNGGCSADATSSRNHLSEIASHGYLVIASGRVPAGGPSPAPERSAQAAPSPPAGPLPPAATRTEQLREAIDWAIREDRRAGSRYQGRIATDRIAVSGWSCGGLQALDAASDPRVTTAVIMNSGFFNDGASPIGGVASDKTMLDRIRVPILYVLGGPSDIAFANGMDDFKRIKANPAAIINIPVGHAGTYFQPNGGIAAKVVTSWLDWQLKGDAKAGRRFTGAECGYCGDSRFTIERKNLD